MRMDRPVGIFLLMWPTLWCLWIAAGGIPDLDLLMIFILGTVLMRAAGCCVNDFADRDFDGHVERTKERPLAKKMVSSREALGLCALATGWAQSKIGAAGAGTLAEKPELTATVIILVAIPETMVILGFVIASMILLME